MPEYVLFVYEDEQRVEDTENRTGSELQNKYQEFIALNQDSVRVGQRLHPQNASTAIRPQSPDGVAITDGAFIESKEVIGGFFLIEAADLDQAISIAKQIPAPFGGVEIRPVRPIG